MQTEKFFQLMSDGTEIAVNRWIPDDEEKIRGIIQLSHGMQEHSLRYDRLGCVLAEAGFVFSAHDHRGHGKTAYNAQQKGKGMFGKLADKNGFERVVEDLDEIISELQKDFPEKKTVLLGHSFGSFVSQSYIENHGEKLAGCILCGTAGPNRAKINAGKVLMNVLRFFRGGNSKSKFAQNVAFSGYNKKFSGKNGDLDWLSANPANVEMYKNDAWCGGVSTLSFFCDLMHGINLVHSEKNMKKIPQNLPVLFIYGSDDPVGDYGKTIKLLADTYKKNGMKDVSLIEYPGDRHELFNELDSDKITQDVLNWLEKNIAL